MNNIKKDLLVLVHYFVGYMFVYPLVFNFIKDDYLYLTVNYLILFVITLLIVYKDLKSDLKNFGDKALEYLNKAANYFVVLELLSMAVNIIINPDNNTNQNMLIDQIVNFKTITIIYTCIIAPICEEVVFRLALNRLFTKVIGKTGAFLLTAFSFAFLHLVAGIFEGNFQIVYLITYLIPALVLGYCYYKEENIWLNIAIHMFNNGLACYALLKLLG